jgi:MaoC like domain
MAVADLIDAQLGQRFVGYDEDDAALYALAVGARPDDLALVYERDLHVLPTYAAALGIWATQAAADAAGYDVAGVLHVAQSVKLVRPLPRAADVEMTARVVNVYDKTSAAVVEIEVESELFVSCYTMFVPSHGGWGGDRGPSVKRHPIDTIDARVSASIAANAAALYRLTGDRHPVHIDPEVAQATGHRGPILHGLCTLGTVVRESAAAIGIRPWQLTEITAGFSAPVYPSDRLDIAVRRAGTAAAFDARVGQTLVIGGSVTIGAAEGADR